MKLKRPPQPLVFQYENVTALCTAVVQLYPCRPWQAALCLYRGRYYLSIGCALGRRQEARRLANMARYTSRSSAWPATRSSMGFLWNAS